MLKVAPFSQENPLSSITFCEAFIVTDALDFIMISPSIRICNADVLSISIYNALTSIKPDELAYTEAELYRHS